MVMMMMMVIVIAMFTAFGDRKYMFLQNKCFGSVSNKLKLSDSKRGGGPILQGDAENDDYGSDE